MTFEMGFVFVVTIGTIVLFATERLRPDLLSLSVLCLLAMTKILTPNEVLSCFSNPGPVTIAAMFILAEGLTRTDALDGISQSLLKLADKGETYVLGGLMLLAVFVSAFINNTAVVAFFMPVVMLVCTQKKMAPSRLLIPLSYGSLLGGIGTLIGTSTNIVVDSIAQRLGQPPVRMFEQTAVGAIMGLAGIAYMVLIGRHLLPTRETMTSLLGGNGGKEYRTDLVVLRNSPLVGQRLRDVQTKFLRAGTVLGVTRAGSDLEPPFGEIHLEGGDRILVSIPAAAVRNVQATPGLRLLPEAEMGIEELATETTTLIEAIVPIDSPLLGKSLRELDFAHRHGVRILALHRHGLNVQERLEEMPLRFGDTLLLQGTEEAIERIRHDRALL